MNKKVYYLLSILLIMSAVGCNKSESKNITNTAETSSEL